MSTAFWDPGAGSSNSSKDFGKLFSSQAKNFQLCVTEEQSHYLVQAKVPGAIIDDFHIRFVGTELFVSVARKRAKSNGLPFAPQKIAFERQIVTEKISYLYEKQMLRIWLPKKVASSKFWWLRRILGK